VVLCNDGVMYLINTEIHESLSRRMKYCTGSWCKIAFIFCDGSNGKNDKNDSNDRINQDQSHQNIAHTYAVTPISPASYQTTLSTFLSALSYPIIQSSHHPCPTI
jgi:uncharacterized sporulation protein YeaH/YhbH (DUF444 family)